MFQARVLYPLLILLLALVYTTLLIMAPSIKYDEAVNSVLSEQAKTDPQFVRNYKFLGLGLRGYVPCYKYRLGFPHDSSDREYVCRRDIFGGNAQYGYEN